jgi:hypothetical protein
MPGGLRDMDNQHAIPRPGGLLDDLEFLHEIRFDIGDRFSDSIDRGDVAEAALISLWHPKAANKTFELIKAGDYKIAQRSLEGFFEGL